MTNKCLYEKAEILDKEFPIAINYNMTKSVGLVYYSHWHEQLEVLYFIEGKGTIKFNSHSIEANPGDLILINSNEPHSSYCIDKPFAYYCIMFDSLFLGEHAANHSVQRYIDFVKDNLVVFENNLSEDSNITNCIKNVINEYECRQPGYELLIKSFIYKFLGLLYRNHIHKVLSEKERIQKHINYQRINKVISYIEQNYMNTITVDQLAELLCLSRYHFCHLFKKVTGKSVIEYINAFRINQAEILLKNTDMNITEVALATGFNDSNYFSRIFRKHKNITPSMLRKTSD